MSVPRFDSTGGVYLLRWQDERVEMRLDRLHEDSKYSVTAEIKISTTTPGMPSHIHQARYNLTSTDARTRLSNYLEKRVQMDWAAMLEQASVKVLERYREGNPIIKMATHEMPERLGMRLDPILQERQATVVFGEGDTLKSFFAIFSAVLVGLGIPHAGLTPEPGNVLYLDYETDEDTIWSRIDMITAGLAYPIPESLYYRQMHQPLAADIEQINRLVLEHSIDLIIVDSAAPAVLEPESASMTTEYFRALRSLNITSQTIAHIPKNSKDEYPFGSSFWRNLPRANFKVNASREGDNVVIGLKNTKSNNGVRLSDMGFEFVFENGSLNVRSAQVVQHPDLAADLPLREKIAYELSHGAMSTMKLAETLSVDQKVIATTISRNKQMFVQVGHGDWGNRVFGGD